MNNSTAESRFNPPGQSVTLDSLLQEADRCVKCGLCLPACPTYLKLANEADSPRGRIALMQALGTHELGLTPALEVHLDRCLGCRACERVCPSGVAYGELIDGVRAINRKKTNPIYARILLRALDILSDREWLKRIFYLLPPLRRVRLFSVARRFVPGVVRRLLQVAQTLPERSAEPGLYPAYRPSGRSVQLFIGCVSSRADQPAIVAATDVLRELGYAVEITPKQVCCGALHRHNGYVDEADRLCEINRQWARGGRAEALITLASACNLELSEQSVSHLPILGVIEFLQGLEAQTQLKLNPLSARVAVHVPCTARDDRTVSLLESIPGLEVFALSENPVCCGAAGSYLLTQPALATQLGQDKIALLRSTRADILVTSNTGCAIQFRMQIEAAGLAIEVLHPVEMIYRQMIGSGYRA